MKQGKTLTQLAAELERRKDVKQDIVASTTVMQMVTQPEGNGVTEPAKYGVSLEIGPRSVGINSVAHGQLAEHLKVPKPYYDRMLATAPALLADNVNHWLHDKPEARMVRMMDGRARAFLSDRYRPLENEQLAEAVIPVLIDLGVEVVSCEVTDTRMYIKAVDKSIAKDVPYGKKIGDGSHAFFDTMSPAITIRNSEVGWGALAVDTSVLTKMCTNLATIDRAGSLKQYHIGGKHDIGEEMYSLLSENTRRLNDVALWAKVRDVVKNAFDRARFEALIDDKVLGMTTRPIEGDVIKVIDLSAKRFGMTDGEKGSVLKHLIEGGDLTQYGLFNAVTRTAQDLEDYDRATTFEALGGKIIELPANDWRVLAKAA